MTENRQFLGKVTISAKKVRKADDKLISGDYILATGNNAEEIYGRQF